MTSFCSLALLLLAVLPSVNGHAYMSKPKSRNMVHGIGPKFGGSGDGSLGGAGNIQNLNAVSNSFCPLAFPLYSFFSSASNALCCLRTAF